MSAPYTAKLDSDISSFDYNGATYGGGSTYRTESACDMKGFINAFSAANTDSGVRETTRGVLAELERECPATPNDVTPQPGDAGTPPVETNPDTGGGDSADMQGAPTPNATGSVANGGTSTDTPPTEEPVRPPNGEPHPTHGGEQPQEQTDGGDPVDLFNGAFYIDETDLEIPNTIFPLSFIRTYRSGDAAMGPLGWNWDHNYNQFLRELNTGDIALWRNLHEHRFTFNGINFDPPRGVFEKLERVGGITQAYELLAEGGITKRFERPAGWVDGERIPLLWIKDRHGNMLRFTYGTEDKIAEVRDDDDRYLHFEYDACGLLVAVSDHAGRKYIYEHDEQTMQLTHVTSPATADHPDGITKIYHYEHPWEPTNLRHNIVRVEDMEGNIYVENTYEKDPAAWHFGMVTEQLYGGYLYQFRYTHLQWVPADAAFINIPALRVEVMNPDYGVETYTFNYRGDLLDKRQRLNKDKSFRVVAWMYEFDEQGNLAIATSPNGGQQINTYDFANPDPRMRNKLLQKEITAASGFPSPSRIIWKAKYEPAYQLIKEQVNEAGATSEYEYDFDVAPLAPGNSGKLLRYIQPDATLPDGTIQQSTIQYEYNTRGQITAIVHPDGSREAFVYGAAGNEAARVVKKTTDSGGLNIESKIKYDVYGYDAKLTDANGNITTKVSNTLGQVESAILPAINGMTAAYHLHYDADKNIITTERPKGAFTDAALTGNHIADTFERDVLGHATKYILSRNTMEARTVEICADFRGLPVHIVNPDGSVVRKVYDERGLPVSEEQEGVDGSKLVSEKVYTREGKLLQETDLTGRVTQYEYDAFSRISKITLPNKSELRKIWLKDDLLASEEITGADGQGNTRQLSMKVYTYDEKGRRTTETIKSYAEDPALAVDVTNTYFYDNRDRIASVVDNRGGTKTNHYDGAGRLVLTADAMGNEEHHFYDSNGNLIRTDNHHIEPDSTVSVFTKRFVYDARNRKIETIEPDGAKVVAEFDDRDMLVRTIDHSGIATEYSYNSFNNKTREIQDVGGIAATQQWTLDNMSRITAYTDATGQVSHYETDALGRVRRIRYPNGFSSTRVYNDRAQLISEQLGSGVVFEYGYDVSGRLVNIDNTTTPSGITSVPQHQFLYDGLDRVVTAQAGTNTVTRRHDSMNRLWQEITSGITLTCTYDDSAGTVTQIWPDDRREQYTHNLNGIVTHVAQLNAGVLGAGSGVIADIVPSGPMFLGESRYRGNLTIGNKYDDRKRLTDIALDSAGMAEEIKYRYDSSNRRQVEALLGQRPKISYFNFDNKSRLLEAKDGFATAIANAVTQPQHDAALAAVQLAATAANHEELFNYNAADERTLYRETDVPDRNYTYAAGHRLQNDGTDSYTYYTEGMLQADGNYTYQADAMGRIVNIKSGGTDVCTIAYDALGRMSAITEAGKPTRTLHYMGSFVAQENEAGNAVRQITRHQVTGMPIAYHTASGLHYTLFDSRYNLVGLADDAGNLVETYRYKSFGAPELFDAGGSSLATSAFGIDPIFGGQRYLGSTGLYLSKRRLMNPVNGVYLSADPRGYADSPSLYAYTAQDPVNNTDPNGEVIPFIVAAFVIGGALAGAGYSVYDAYHHPDRYEGWQGSLRVLGNVFGGALIGGAAIVASEAVLAVGGVGIFASGTGATVTSLTAGQTFVLFGTSSAASGYILRSGFNNMFPEYVNPASAGTIATDFAAGGSIGVAFRGLVSLAQPAAEAAETAAGAASPPQSVGNWFRFWGDQGGSAPIASNLGPYPGRIGALLDRVGIRQGYSSNVINNDIGGSWFARTDTAWHEGFHAFVARYFPTFRDLSRVSRLGAYARYPEEVVAYAVGHGAAGRIHGIPLAPLEAFNSLAGYGPTAVRNAKIFWGTVWAAGAGGAAYYWLGGEAHAAAPPPGTATPPPKK